MKVKYKVTKDLQGGEFGMYRELTIEQWRNQAIEWAEMDDNYDLVDILNKLKPRDVINYISEVWELEFKKIIKKGINK